MKYLKYIAIALLMVTSTNIEAKKIKVPHVYMFGFSASFQDSTIYITDIQDVPDAWMDTKSKFLLGRDSYSYQLKNYLTDQQQPNRVCMVFFATKKAKAEKQYAKVLKKYTNVKNKKRKKTHNSTTPSTYDIKYITPQEFKFETVDMSDE